MPGFNPIGFYEELRRRRVFQVAVLYGVAAWGVIGACDILFPQAPEVVAQPERALRWVIIAAIAIAPLVLIFGWLYDLTVEGVQRTPSFSELAHDPDTSLHRVDRWVIGGLSAAFIGIVAAAVIKIAQLEPLAPPATAAGTTVALDPMALAVLPLRDRSAEGENAELLAFGLHDTLLTTLSRIGAVRVLSRTTMERYQGTTKSLPEIARELGVANVMEGTVQRVGNQVRITVQLIRAPRDEHVWSEVYDRELSASNLFEIQTEIARAVAVQLAAALSPEEDQRLAVIPTSNTEAYTAYMLGRQRLRDRKVELIAQAVEQFARAIEFDPNYAAAYSGLADACRLYEGYSGGPLATGCPKDAAGHEELIRKGLAIDDTVGELWVSLGDALASQWQSQRENTELAVAARTTFERGLQLSPSFSQGYHWYAMRLGSSGTGLGGTDPDLGVNIALKGLRVDPLSLPLNYQLSVFFDARHEFDEAFRYARRLIEIAPDSPRGHERLAELEGTVNGRMDKMILGMTHAARLDVRHAWFLVSAGSAYANLGDYDMALRYYEKAASLVEHSSRETARFALHRAVALLHLGRREKAVAVLKQVVESEGRGLGNLAVAMLADLSLQEGRARDALSYWKSLFPECFDGGSISSSCRHIEWRLRIARVLQELGQPEEMQRLEPELLANLEADRAEVDAAAWRLGFYSPGGIFDVRVLAALGRREQALAALEQAVDQGWRGWAGPHWPGEWKYDMQLDSLMDAIRDDARFKAAFARIEADRSEQLEIVREMERRGEIPSRDELPEPKFEE